MNYSFDMPIKIFFFSGSLDLEAETRNARSFSNDSTKLPILSLPNTGKRDSKYQEWNRGSHFRISAFEEHWKGHYAPRSSPFCRNKVFKNTPRGQILNNFPSKYDFDRFKVISKCCSQIIEITCANHYNSPTETLKRLG